MAGDVVESVREIGYDIASSMRRVLLTEELFDSADVVIMITAKDTWPEYIDGEKVIFWDIDGPQGLGRGALEGARTQIAARVKNHLSALPA
jgi:protein-tyrosine-phosphatase